MTFQAKHFLYSSPGSKANRRAVFSFCLGSEALHHLSLLTAPSHSAYSMSNKADYYLFTESYPGLPKENGSIHQCKSGITYNKLAYLRLLSSYHEVLYLDLDVIISSKAPSIFELYSGSSASVIAFNEAHLDLAGKKQAINEITSFLGGSEWPETIYFNSGVFLVRPDALELDKLIPEKLFTGLWSEQTYLNWMIHNHNLSWLELDRRFNCIVPLGSENEVAQSYFWHFAGMTSPGGFNDKNSYEHRTQYVAKFIMTHSALQFNCTIQSLNENVAMQKPLSDPKAVTSDSIIDRSVRVQSSLAQKSKGNDEEYKTTGKDKQYCANQSPARATFDLSSIKSSLLSLQKLTNSSPMKKQVALLLRGPLRLPPAIHARLALDIHSLATKIFPGFDVIPFLLTYTNSTSEQLESCLSYASILKIREPSIEDFSGTEQESLLTPFANGGSRLNAFKQYYSMQAWVDYFRASPFACDHIFYARTDVAVDIPDLSPWRSDGHYTSAHVKGKDGAPWSCDYIGSAPTSLFCKAWDFGSERNLLDAVVNAEKGEDPLDELLQRCNIPTSNAVMRFGGHLIRSEDDFAAFWS